MHRACTVHPPCIHRASTAQPPCNSENFHNPQIATQHCDLTLRPYTMGVFFRQVDSPRSGPTINYGFFNLTASSCSAQQTARQTARQSLEATFRLRFND